MELVSVVRRRSGAVGVNAVAATLTDRLPAHLLDQLDDCGLRYNLCIPNGHEQVAVPQVVLNLLVVGERAVLKRLVKDLVNHVWVYLALVVFEVGDLAAQDLQLLGLLLLDHLEVGLLELLDRGFVQLLLLLVR